MLAGISTEPNQPADMIPLTKTFRRQYLQCVLSDNVIKKQKHRSHANIEQKHDQSKNGAERGFQSSPGSSPLLWITPATTSTTPPGTWQRLWSLHWDLALWKNVQHRGAAGKGDMKPPLESSITFMKCNTEVQVNEKLLNVRLEILVKRRNSYTMLTLLFECFLHLWFT